MINHISRRTIEQLYISMSQYSSQQVEGNRGVDFAGGLSFGDAPESTNSLDAAFGDLSETPLFITTALSQMRDGKFSLVSPRFSR